jgi:DNA-binding transcriptional regulator GbsR (MarR family)
VTRNAAAVFGALRYANEHELDVATIAARTNLSWRAVSAALRDLRALGVVHRRTQHGAYGPRRGRFFSIHQERR